MAVGRGDLALLAFIGGLSAATSMVIVASIALSIIDLEPLGDAGAPAPAAVHSTSAVGEFSTTLLMVRRLSIVVVLSLGYAYHRTDRVERSSGVDRADLGSRRQRSSFRRWSAGCSGSGRRGTGRWQGSWRDSPSGPGRCWRPTSPPRGSALGRPGPPFPPPPRRGGGGPVRHRLAAGRTPCSASRAGDPLVHGTMWSITINLAAFVTCVGADRALPA